MMRSLRAGCFLAREPLWKLNDLLVSCSEELFLHRYGEGSLDMKRKICCLRKGWAYFFSLYFRMQAWIMASISESGVRLSSVSMVELMCNLTMRAGGMVREFS
jgi:hypothetical protein